VLDGSDHPHISYYTVDTLGSSPAVLRYAWRDGITWHIETVPLLGGSDTSDGTALALGARSELPHIIFHTQSPDFDIRHAWYDGTQWRFQIVDDDGNVGTGESLSIDTSGQLYLGYGFARCTMFRCDNDLKYAQYDGIAWRVETLDRTGAVGPSSSLALDGRGHPHISYAETYPTRSLWYARHDGTVWYRETIDNTGDADEDSVSLALDGLGRPHISYAAGDYPFRNVRYARHDGSGWHIEVVDDTDAQDYDQVRTSLALDAVTGRPHISYYGPGLKYAWNDGAAWQIEVLDVGQRAGMHSSLALDGMGHPHISYFDNTNGDLKYAWHDGAGWHVETVDTEGWVGWSNSLALDGADRPHISYQDASSYDLKHAWHDGTAWRIETVDSEGDVGASTSLALDEFGLVHISYHDVDNQDLKYAWKDGTGWHTERVDTEGYVGWQSSLTLDINTGRPHTSYYDYSRSAIKYARLTPLPALNKQAAPSDGVRVNEALTFTLTFSGPGLSFRLWDPLPPQVRYVTDTLTTSIAPPAVYSPTGHAVSWVGSLPHGSVQMVRFQLTPGITSTGSLSLSAPILNSAWLTDTERGFSVSATVIVNGWRGLFPFFPGDR
jgi:hypothetical protein